jgi:hypothetical protein
VNEALQLDLSGQVTCPDGSTRPFGFPLSAPLKKTRFSRKVAFDQATLKISGSFTANTRLKGTVSVVTNNPTCKSGSIGFTGKR